MIKKYTVILIVILFTSNCGFTPVYLNEGIKEMVKNKCGQSCLVSEETTEYNLSKFNVSTSKYCNNKYKSNEQLKNDLKECQYNLKKVLKSF